MLERGRLERAREEHEMAMARAWHTARLSAFTKTLPSLADFLGRGPAKERQPPLTPEQAAAQERRVAEATASFAVDVDDYARDPAAFIARMRAEALANEAGAADPAASAA